MNMRRHKKNTYFGYRSFWPEPEAHREFDSIGVDTVCFFAANTSNSFGEPYCKYLPIWVADGSRNPDGKYDFSPADSQIKDLIRDCPNANFICIVDLNTPLWLNRLFRCDTMTELGRLCSDPEWRRVTAKYMRNFLSYMEERYGRKIIAYVLSGGNTSEWYDLSCLMESKSRFVAWNEELKLLGRFPADIPGRMVREHVSFDNLLRDPQVDGDALLYIKFCAKQVVDTIKFFLREARTVIRSEVELGVFYGYPLILSGERVIQGNNDCRELLKCPDIDFLISPHWGADLGPTESILLSGKGYMRECDQRTHTFNRNLSKHVSLQWPNTWKNEEETIAGIKQELSYTLIKQCSVWWFDMWGGFYKSPAVMTTLERARKIYREYIDIPAGKVAETVLIVDEDSIPYLNQNDNSRTAWFYNHTKHMLMLMGAPFECYSFDDIPKIPNIKRFKLWLLPGIFEITPEKQELLDLYVRCCGQTVIYLYAPGISDGQSLDPSRVKQLTGFEFGSPGVNVTDLSGYRSVYVFSGDDLTVRVLKDIAIKSGVHIYSEYEQPVYANNILLAVHTRTGGVQKISLPRRSAEVKELFSGHIVAKDCLKFNYGFQSPDTALFSW